MLQNYLKIALRNLFRHSGYAFINLGGLTVGIACCLVVVVFVRDELSYDQFHKYADRTYRITATMKMSDKEVPTRAPGLLGPTLVENLPGLVKQVRVRCMNEPVVVEYETERFSESALCFADPTLFEVFDFSLQAGDPRTALTRPYGLVLSRTLARKYFGDRDPVGQMLKINGEQAYEVTGVLDPPAGRSHLQFGLLASFTTLVALDPNIETWAEGGANPYVVLAPNYRAEELKAHLDEHLDDYMGYFAGGIKAHLQHLTSIYFSDWPATTAERRGDVRYLYLFATVALLILLIACINYMNLAIARALRRTGEVGLRKAIGATRRQLIRQFLSESVLLSFIAFLIAFVLAWLTLPRFGELVDRNLEASRLLDVSMLLVFTGIALLVGVIAGSYPAFYLSASNPVSVLKGKSGAGRQTAWVRKGLVVAQFAASIGLVASTLVLWNQLNYVRNKQLGFDKEHVVLLTPTEEMKDQYAALKHALLELPEVAGVTTAPMPGHTHVMIISHRAEGYDHEATGNAWIATFDVDYDFLDLLKIKLLAGRDFDPALSTDLDDAVLVNEAAVRNFGWGSPREALGKWVKKPQGRGEDLRWVTYRVVGVVEDFQSWTMKENLRPIFIYLTTDEVEKFGKVLVKIQPSDISSTLARLEAVWATFAPNRAFDYAFLDQEVDQFYRADIRQGRLLSVFAALSVLVACLGLFGLAAFMAEQRTKEIGIRKVLGASVPSIIKLLCGDYLILVGVAFTVATPITYAIMQRWLSQFAYSAGIGWEMMILVGVGALLVALATVSYQSIKAALADPVKALRYE